MKRLFLCLLVVSMTARAEIAEKTNLAFRFGVMQGKFHTIKDFSKEKTEGRGYQLALEVTEKLGERSDFGFGIAYQDHSKPVIGKASRHASWEEKDEYNEMKAKLPKFRSIPVYVTARYYLPLGGKWKSYIKGDLGYSFNRFSRKKIALASLDYEKVNFSYTNGLYCAFGLGLEYENLQLDLMYQQSKTKFKMEVLGASLEDKADYRGLCLSLGYKI